MYLCIHVCLCAYKEITITQINKHDARIFKKKKEKKGRTYF